ICECALAGCLAGPEDRRADSSEDRLPKRQRGQSGVPGSSPRFLRAATRWHQPTRFHAGVNHRRPPTPSLLAESRRLQRCFDRVEILVASYTNPYLIQLGSTKVPLVKGAGDTTFCTPSWIWTMMCGWPSEASAVWAGNCLPVWFSNEIDPVVPRQMTDSVAVANALEFLGSPAAATAAAQTITSS